MIWFAPTQHLVQMRWFGEFMGRLYEGSPSVLALLQSNPFPDQPPGYLRVLVYDYRFSDTRIREETGNGWQIHDLELFPQ